MLRLACGGCHYEAAHDRAPHSSYQSKNARPQGQAEPLVLSVVRIGCGCSTPSMRARYCLIRRKVIPSSPTTTTTITAQPIHSRPSVLREGS